LALSRQPTLKVLATCVALVALAACGGPFPQSTLRPTGDLTFSIDHLLRLIVWLAAGVFVVVEGLLVYAVIRFRARPAQAADQGTPAERAHGNTVLEISWTLAPVVILTIVAVPTIQTIIQTEERNPPGALEVAVTGHQWWWEFHYPGDSIVTANELHIPVGRPIEVSITSADVIHSFWTPRIAAKRDAIPGRTNHVEFTADSVGTFPGQCAEFCGASHANMGLRVMVEDSASFAAWVADQERPPVPADSMSPLAQRGAALYKTTGCIACHTIRGISVGTLGPNLTHVGSRTTIAAGTLPNTAEGLARWLHDPPAVKPGSKMPSLGLNDDQVTALAAYLLSLK
jgi:cytochrome c oxidase subunit 2